MWSSINMCNNWKINKTAWRKAPSALRESRRGYPCERYTHRTRLAGVDEQSTRHTSTPKGRFVLRADSIRPYGLRRQSRRRVDY